MIEALAGQGHADQAAAVGGHEVDDFRRDALGGDGEIAFVFAVLVVDDDDDAAVAQFVDGFGDGNKSHGPCFFTIAFGEVLDGWHVGEGHFTQRCGVGSALLYATSAFIGRRFVVALRECRYVVGLFVP